MKTNFLILIALALTALLVLSSCSARITSSPGSGLQPAAAPASSAGSPVPVTEGTILIRGCHPDPEILQVKTGDLVTFVNTDGQEHTIFMDNQEHLLPAKGTVSLTATASMPTPFTSNYLCDTKSSGAIFITR